MSTTRIALYRAIASAVKARENCAKTDNSEWFDRHTKTVEFLVKNYMPSGSGIDCGTKIDWDRTAPELLTFTFSYHHMDDGGCYDGWTEHTLKVWASLAHEFKLHITGRDRNQIKEYLYDTYQYALKQLVDPHPEPRGSS